VHREWAKAAEYIIHERREPSFRHLIEFLERSLSTATNMYGQLASRSSRMTNKHEDVFGYRSGIHRSRVNAVISKDVTCPICSSPHSLSSCGEFQAKTQEQKFSTLMEHKLCFNCFKHNHRAGECRAPHRCDRPGCGKRHHELLHIDRNPNASTSFTANIHSHATQSPSAFLGFIPVRLIGPKGAVVCYAFLDSGSDTTLVSRDLATRIGLRGTATELTISSITGTSTRSTTSVCFSIESINQDYRADVDAAHVVDQLPVNDANLPSEALLQRYPHLRDVRLTYLPSGKVSILIGTNVPEAHWVMSNALVQGNSHMLHRYTTLFSCPLICHDTSPYLAVGVCETGKCTCCTQ
jgi:hypothetical protein